MKSVRKSFLEKKSAWVRREVLSIHRTAKEPRLSSSLSCVEIFVALYYGGVVKYDPSDLKWEKRDRMIVSKGHGGIPLYPIFADLGFFHKKELKQVCREDALLGSMPDPNIPGFETINGSLGHGLGVACGMALALKRTKNPAEIFVLLGDGELYEGSVWEAIMFAAHRRLDNLTVIVDNNKVCMLGRCRNVLNLEPLEKKFEVFGWDTVSADGHDVSRLADILEKLKKQKRGKPKIIVADTVKGKGVPILERDALSHIKTLTDEQVDATIGGMK